MRTLAHTGRRGTARQAAARRAIAVGWVAFVPAYGFALLLVALT